MYPSDGVHTEKFIPTNQMIDCNFFTRLGIDWEQASKNFPFRKISIRTGLHRVIKVFNKNLSRIDLNLL